MTIELDAEQARSDMITLAGGKPIGERGGLAWFTDPITKSTLVIEIELVTVENVKAKLASSRRTFATRIQELHHA